MADSGAERVLAAPFPPPPPFWKHFTTDNLNKLEQIKEERSKQETGFTRKKKWTPTELQSLNVSSEIRYLIPPEIPKTGTYTVFGEPQILSTTLPSLEEQGIEQLYPSSLGAGKAKTSTPSGSSQSISLPLNHAYYLLKISKSLLLNFLEFVGILSVEPEQFETKLEDLRNLFINAHHLLNLYRPHQARESLVLMMEEQLDRTREEIEKIDRTKELIENLLKRLRTDGVDAASALPSRLMDSKSVGDLEDMALKEARQVWDLLNEDRD